MNIRTWSAVEIEELRSLTSQQPMDWKWIAEQIKTKTAQQCANRFHNIEKFGPSPMHQRNIWTQKLDEKLMCMAEETERNWRAVSQQLRITVSVVKNRFYVLQRKGFFISKNEAPKLLIFDYI
ncbi:Myb-like DNA-binding domain-containing protein [Spironucleus salmonicida]|uniref:Myb-like DNA-binding domain-containing protein n=1 Tax=Spironucleus salmonicida TaxID=348837 RepID=V6LXY6_9EUKA|nr:Myb-like DNA-binding domain-containing protein [Spironucleus salmonicida]|eukprot:EST49507.1 Myb-like DNA-binding domain-containing protein [Spironucleus salmonicida]